MTTSEKSSAGNDGSVGNRVSLEMMGLNPWSGPNPPLALQSLLQNERLLVSTTASSTTPQSLFVPLSHECPTFPRDSLQQQEQRLLPRFTCHVPTCPNHHTNATTFPLRTPNRSSAPGGLLAILDEVMALINDESDMYCPPLSSRSSRSRSFPLSPLPYDDPRSSPHHGPRNVYSEGSATTLTHTIALMSSPTTTSSSLACNQRTSRRTRGEDINLPEKQ